MCVLFVLVVDVISWQVRMYVVVDWYYGWFFWNVVFERCVDVCFWLRNVQRLVFMCMGFFFIGIWLSVGYMCSVVLGMWWVNLLVCVGGIYWLCWFQRMSVGIWIEVSLLVLILLKWNFGIILLMVCCVLLVQKKLVQWCSVGLDMCDGLLYILCVVVWMMFLGSIYGDVICMLM